MPHERAWGRWQSYLGSDADAAAFRPDAAEAFPSLRLRDGLAIVGVTSAQPTKPFLASGRVGAAQLERLDALLARLADAGLCRVVAIHHPPVPGAASRRRALRDAAAFARVLRRRGAELVLHGHLHRTRIDALPGPHGPVPVVGVPSASHAGPAPERCAAYHLYDIERAGAARFAIRRRARAWNPASRRFEASGPTDGEPL
jgi:3',5'-cyclic AMP phosphodiesterase CpdA